jgi:hypothetical protein
MGQRAMGGTILESLKTPGRTPEGPACQWGKWLHEPEGAKKGPEIEWGKVAGGP